MILCFCYFFFLGHGDLRLHKWRASTGPLELWASFLSVKHILLFLFPFLFIAFRLFILFAGAPGLFAMEAGLAAAVAAAPLAAAGPGGLKHMYMYVYIYIYIYHTCVSLSLCLSLSIYIEILTIVKRSY